MRQCEYIIVQDQRETILQPNQCYLWFVFRTRPLKRLCIDHHSDPLYHSFFRGLSLSLSTLPFFNRFPFCYCCADFRDPCQTRDKTTKYLNSTKD